MTNDNKILEKGAYNHPQPIDSVSAKHYLVIGENGKRYLLIRFANETEVTVSDFEFILTQFDSAGKVIDKTKIKYDSISLAPQQTFASKRGIIVKEECVDFSVKIISYFSKSYRYEYKRGGFVAHYDVREKNKKKRKSSFYEEFTIRSQKKAYSRYYALASFIALVALVLSCVLVKLDKVSNTFEFLTYNGADSSKCFLGTSAKEYNDLDFLDI